MPDRRSARIPKYRLHKPSGLAVVRLNGRDVYLGQHGTEESAARGSRNARSRMTMTRTTPMASPQFGICEAAS